MYFLFCFLEKFIFVFNKYWARFFIIIWKKNYIIEQHPNHLNGLYFDTVVHQILCSIATIGASMVLLLNWPKRRKRKWLVGRHYYHKILFETQSYVSLCKVFIISFLSFPFFSPSNFRLGRCSVCVS
jgi:hypothetical protein